MQGQGMRGWASIVERGVGYARRERRLRQLDDCSALKTAKRIGLGGPIEIAKRTREATEVMLGRFVIAPRYCASCVMRRSSSAIAWFSCCLRVWCVVSSSCRCISVFASRSDSS